MDDELLNTKEAAKYLGIGWQSLNQSRSRVFLRGKISPKYVKDGRSIFYKKTDLDLWKNAKVVNPRRPPFWNFKF
jgi:hypothetical protein